MHNLVKTCLTTYNLSNIRRFAGLPMIKDQSVADHRSTLMFLVLIIAEYLNKMGYSIDWHRLLSYSMLHDVEESICGDIIYSIKNYDVNLNKSIKEATNSIANDLLNVELVGKELQESFNSYETEKNLEVSIIKACDMLEIAFTSYKEVTMGNKNMQNMLDRSIYLCKQSSLYNTCYLYKELLHSIEHNSGEVGTIL